MRHTQAYANACAAVLVIGIAALSYLACMSAIRANEQALRSEISEIALARWEKVASTPEEAISVMAIAEVFAGQLLSCEKEKFLLASKDKTLPACIESLKRCAARITPPFCPQSMSRQTALEVQP